MIKKFCDFCDKEIQPLSQDQKVVFSETDFEVFDAEGTRMFRTEYLLCDNCFKDLKTYAKQKEAK